MMAAGGYRVELHSLHASELGLRDLSDHVRDSIGGPLTPAAGTGFGDHAREFVDDAGDVVDDVTDKVRDIVPGIQPRPTPDDRSADAGGTARRVRSHLEVTAWTTSA